MPLPGDPDAVLDAADGLARAARGLQDAHEALAYYSRTTGSGWDGAAGALALARIDRDATSARTASEAAGRAVAPLRAFAEELRRAQQDCGLGEQMVRDAEAVAVTPGSGAVAADGAREVMADGTNVMIAAEERALAANEAAARELEAATTLLAEIAGPTTPAPVVGRNGNFGDGLVKALGDVGSEIAGTTTGALAHLNVFSDEFGSTWSNTWDTVTTAVSHPVDAVRAMASGTVAPVGESYASGGLDEALGRTPGVIAGIVGLKGLTKLEKLRLLRNEDSSPVAPGGGLQAHEDAGGHTLARRKAHVGATAEELLERQQGSRRPSSPMSSYFDRTAAERSVHENLAGNRPDVDAWLAGEMRVEAFDFRHDRITGHHLPGNASAPSEARDVTGSRVVLVRDASMPEGYRILTSYPMP